MPVGSTVDTVAMGSDLDKMSVSIKFLQEMYSSTLLEGALETGAPTGGPPVG